MKISIITPICNDAADVSASIQSVLNQTYPDVEYLVVDYGSDERLKGKIRHELNHARYYEMKDGCDLSDAINFGIRRASGDVLCMLSPNEQLFEKGIIQKVVNAFKSSNANVIYGKGSLNKGEGILKDLRLFSTKRKQSKELPFGKIPLHTSIYIKRDVLMDMGFRDKAFSVESEYQLYLRLFMHQTVKPHYIDEFVLKLSLKGHVEPELKNRIHMKTEKMPDYESMPLKNVALT